MVCSQAEVQRLIVQWRQDIEATQAAADSPQESQLRKVLEEAHDEAAGLRIQVHPTPRLQSALYGAVWR